MPIVRKLVSSLAVSLWVSLVTTVSPHHSRTDCCTINKRIFDLDAKHHYSTALQGLWWLSSPIHLFKDRSNFYRHRLCLNPAQWENLYVPLPKVGGFLQVSSTIPQLTTFIYMQESWLWYTTPLFYSTPLHPKSLNCLKNCPQCCQATSKGKTSFCTPHL